MNTPDPNLSPTERDAQHEQLCAYLLGECTPAERSQIEAALEAQPELAAERDRLAGVLGLVQGALAGEERLSEGALSSLLEAATAGTPLRSEMPSGDSHGGPRPVVGHESGASGAPRTRGFASSPFLRSAAAVLLVICGVWTAYKHPGTTNYDETVAHADRQVGGAADEARDHVLGQALTQRVDRGSRNALRTDEPSSDPVVAEVERQIALFKSVQFAFESQDYKNAERYSDALLELDANNLYARRLKDVAGELGEVAIDDPSRLGYTAEWESTFTELGLTDVNEIKKLDLNHAYWSEVNARDVSRGLIVKDENGRDQVPVDVWHIATPETTVLDEYVADMDVESLSPFDSGAFDNTIGLGGGAGGLLGRDPMDSAGVPNPTFGAGAKPRHESLSSIDSLQFAQDPAQQSAAIKPGGAALSRTATTSGLSTTAPATKAGETIVAETATIAGGNPSRRGSGGGGAVPFGVVGPDDVIDVLKVAGVGSGAGYSTASNGANQPTAGLFVEARVPAAGGGGGSTPTAPSPSGPGSPAGTPSVRFAIADAQPTTGAVNGASGADKSTLDLSNSSGVVPEADSTLMLIEAKPEVLLRTVAEAKEKKAHVAEAARASDLAAGVGFELEVESYDEFGLGLERNRQEDEGRRPVFTPKQIDEGVRITFDHICEDARRKPHERPRDMYFRWWGDNPWEVTQTDKLSTFAADVDTASYVLARRYLREGNLPTKAQIRTEEFVNYFDPDIAAPTEGTFAIQTELAPSLFGGSERRWQLRVGVRGKEIADHERPPMNLTFVVDTSGSMEENNRLELVKHALRLLVGQLDGRDAISIVAFAKEARLILPLTSAANRGVIESAIHPLTPDGGTHAESGLMMGYEVALAGLNAQAQNRVIFLSDGVANLGETDQDRINANVTRHKDAGIYLNTIGVGMSNHNDVFLEQLANKGDGIFDYVDDAASTERAIVERFVGALVPIASDVKIQVDFDPAQVLRYRLLGYENRAIADADFRNDKIDAGEVGAGHQVTAIYEIERAGGPTPMDTPLATVRLRWKEPKAPFQDEREISVTEVEHTVLSADASGSWDAASLGFRRASLVAQLAECLRGSTHARGDSLDALRFEMQRIADHPEYAQDSDTAELPGLVQRAIDLGVERRFFRSELGSTVDEYRRHKYLCEQLDELDQRTDARGIQTEDLIRLKHANDELEDRIQDLIRKDLQTRTR